MKILFIHQNMPGQYKYLCRAFANDPQHQVVFITKPKNFDLPNVHKAEYVLSREPSISTHRYIVGLERSVLTGQEVWRVCNQLKRSEGFVPDVICCHPGWGDAMFIKDIYPDVPVLSFFEFYYRFKGADVGFDPEHTPTSDDAARVRVKNATNLLSLESMDWGISPTLWQQQVHPKEFIPRISVLHDGINTDICKPNPDTHLTINDQQYKLGDEVVTYIARNFEPYRGFPTFMRAASIILKERPNCKIIAVGADEVSYGKRLAKGDSWRHRMLREVDIDEDRLIFPGVLSYSNLIKLFQISAAHIYLTYPFVLSWSSMEAMACGCAMVASRTPPVMEVMRHEENALLADFHSPDEVAAQVLNILDSKDLRQDLRDNARKTIVEQYSLGELLPLHKQLVTDIADRKLPPPTHDVIMERHAHQNIARITGAGMAA